MSTGPARVPLPNRGDLGLIRLAVRMALAYRASAVATLAVLVVQLFLLRRLWTAVYGEQASVRGFDLDTMVGYLTLANTQLYVMATAVELLIQTRIRSGVVFFDLIRPVGYLRQMVGLQLGSTIGALLLLVPALPVVLITGSVHPPAGLAAAVLYPVSLALGYGIAVLLALLVGLTAFWTLEIGGVTMLYRLVSQFLAGGMAPLDFFPGWLQVLAHWLPFQYLAYVPAAIYVGQLDGQEVVWTVGVQLAWLLGLSAVVQAVWRRAMLRVVVQGG